MRKIFLTLALALAATSMAQVLEVASVERLDISGTKATVVAGISPKGDYILLTGAQLNGLAKYDLASKKVEVVSKARAIILPSPTTAMQWLFARTDLKKDFAAPT